MSRLPLNTLNPPQREAVTTVDGPLLLLAGAGTGKTRVITVRIAYLIEAGVDAENIMAVTFTNKAAREMKERVAQLLSAKAAAAVTVSTFHSFGCQLLRRHCRHLGYSPSFTIAGSGYQQDLVRGLQAELGLSHGGENAQSLVAAISAAKTALQTPADLRSCDPQPWNSNLAALYELYETRMRNMEMMDFDDLLVQVVRLWQQRPELLARHQQQYQYLLIDEYQDTNTVQFQLMAMLAGERANICAVGDDDQSIYGWRGADIRNILDFNKRFANCKTIRLEQNYRSTNLILQAANEVIAKNSGRHGKSLWSDQGQGDKIMTVSVRDQDEEAQIVAEIIRDRQLSHNLVFDDFAVLYRSNHQAKALEIALRQKRIAYRIVGGQSYFQRREILDALSMLQLVHNPKDNLSLLRIVNVPPRGIGDKAIERLRALQRASRQPMLSLLQSVDFQHELNSAASESLQAFCACIEKFRKLFAAGGDVGELTEALLHESGYLAGLGRIYKPKEDALRRQEMLYEFIANAHSYTKRRGQRACLADFLEGFALADMSDNEEGQAEGSVTLLTVHAAKGLEFPVVFVVGMEAGLFPHDQALKEGGLEEERRLFYVALTRAKQQAILLHARRRRLRGVTTVRRPSLFLQDLPEALVLQTDADGAVAPATAAEQADFLAQMKAMFAPPARESS